MTTTPPRPWFVFLFPNEGDWQRWGPFPAQPEAEAFMAASPGVTEAAKEPHYQLFTAAGISVSLRIENRYEFYETVVTEVTDEIIPALAPDEDEQDWAQEFIYPWTGTGHTDGDSWYDVEVTTSSDPTMVGRKYDFGY